MIWIVLYFTIGLILALWVDTNHHNEFNRLDRFICIILGPVIFLIAVLKIWLEK